MSFVPAVDVLRGELGHPFQGQGGNLAGEFVEAREVASGQRGVPFGHELAACVIHTQDINLIAWVMSSGQFC